MDLFSYNDCRRVAKLLNADGKEHGYFIRTFGCQQNEADSEKLAGMCEAMGYSPSASPENADLILVNTCAVREHAEIRAFSFVGEYKHVKDANPSVIIGVGGCMTAQRSRADKFKHSYPYVDFTFDTSSLHRVPELVYNRLRGGSREFIIANEYKIVEELPVIREKQHKAWLSIMYGCNNFCSYCIVPYTRGRERSRDESSVLNEARMLIESGAKDITLLGQNVNSYNGGDGVTIAKLMRDIAHIDGDFNIRFMTSHPKDASNELISAIAEEPKIVKHFHLPVQSGSDAILARMNRKYNVKSYYDRISRIKAEIPDVSITTDIIIGFPGETEDDFRRTLELIENVGYDLVFSFIYSPRSGTPAAEMSDQIPREVSAERFERLLEVVNRISLERNSRFVGRTLKVLADETSKDSGVLVGRGAPVRPIYFDADEADIGKFVNIKIEKADTFSLNGTVIQ